MSAAADAFSEARLAAARGQESAALSLIERGLALQADHLGCLLLKATLLQSRREDQAAVAVCRHAVRVAPGSVAAWNGLARSLHAAEDDDAALLAAERARELLASGADRLESGPVYLTLVWCLRAKRRFREALAAAEEGLATTPDAVLAHWAGVVEEELAEAETERC